MNDWEGSAQRPGQEELLGCYLTNHVVAETTWTGEGRKEEKGGKYIRHGCENASGGKVNEDSAVEDRRSERKLKQRFSCYN